MGAENGAAAGIRSITVENMNNREPSFPADTETAEKASAAPALQPEETAQPAGANEIGRAHV